MTGLISGISSLVGSVVGGKKAKTASKAAEAASVASKNQAIDLTKSNEDAVNSLYSPYTAFGTDALAGLKTAFDSGDLTRSFSNADFQTDPGYQFRVAQGEGAINSANNARGQYFAPSTIKSLSDYAGNQASQEYQSAYDRFNTNQNNQYARLLGLSSFGLGATNSQATNLTNNTSSLAKLITGIGDDQSQAISDRGAITAKQWTDGAQSAGKIATSIAQMAGGI